MSRSFCFSSFLVAALLLAAALPLYSSWQHLPADGPWLQAIVADSSGQRITVSAMAGGVWQSDDGGATWQPISDHFVADGRVEINHLSALDADADTLWVTGFSFQQGPVGSFSYDGGQSWQMIEDPYVRSARLMEAWRHGHHVWFAINDNPSSCFRTSLDYGGTWSPPVELPMSYVSRMYQDPTQDSTLYLTGQYHGSEGGLVRSTDLGTTWTLVLPIHELFGVSDAWVADVVRMANGELLTTAFGYARQLWVMVSADEGQTWDSVTTLQGLPFEQRLIEDTETPGRIFMTFPSEGGILRSDDYGRTWEAVSGGLPNVLAFPEDLYQNPFSRALYAIYMLNGIYRSNDHGNTWQVVNSPPIGMPEATFSCVPEAVFTSMSAWDPSPYRQWQLETPYTTWQPYTIVLDDLDTLRRASLPWDKDGDTLLAYAQWSPIDAPWNIPPHGAVMRSTDNGESWIAGPPLLTALNFYTALIQRSDTTVRIFASNVWKGSEGQDSLFMSSDKGNTWDFRSVAPGQQGFMKLAGEDDILTATIGGPGAMSLRICRSTNAGLSWTQLGSQYFTTTNLVVLGDDIVATNQEHSMRWHNGLWENRGTIPDGYSYYWWEMIALPSNPPILLGVTGDSNVLWVSRDTAMTWEAYDTELPYHTQSTGLRALSYDSYRNRLWVCAGTGTCYMDAMELSTDGPLVFQPADYTLLSVYPNPFNAEAKIRFDLLKRENVTVKLYDVLGREVKTVVDGMQEMGRHEVALSVPELASGVYFVRLNTSEQTRMAKIVILK